MLAHFIPIVRRRDETSGRGVDFKRVICQVAHGIRVKVKEIHFAGVRQASSECDTADFSSNSSGK